MQERYTAKKAAVMSVSPESTGVTRGRFLGSCTAENAIELPTEVHFASRGVGGKNKGGRDMT